MLKLLVGELDLAFFSAIPAMFYGIFPNFRVNYNFYRMKSLP